MLQEGCSLATFGKLLLVLSLVPLIVVTVVRVVVPTVLRIVPDIVRAVR